MSLKLTAIVLSIYSILIAASITYAISFTENLTKNFNSKREDRQTSNSSSIDYTGLRTTMKMIWMRCEIFKKNFLSPNKHSNISDDVCLIFLIQRLIHIKRQRERLEDYFTFRQGWNIGKYFAAIFKKVVFSSSSKTHVRARSLLFSDTVSQVEVMLAPFGTVTH